MTHITIEGFESLTGQQVFDMAAKHILTKGAPGWSAKRKVCRYNEGCAASVFIKPEQRQYADTDGGSWGVLAKCLMVPEHHVDFIRAIQRVHDGAANNASDYGDGPMDNDVFMVRWSYDMKALGQKYGLNTSVLNS